MAIRIPGILQDKKTFRGTKSSLFPGSTYVPTGYLAVSVGEFQKKRFVAPISFLNHPSFQELLSKAEEEFGFNRSMGGLTIPCNEETFIDLTSRLNRF